MLIGAYAVGASEGVIVCRGEFMEPQRILRAAIAEAEAAGLLGERILGTDFSFKLWVYRTAGAYICGEETSLLEALEGKPGMPRIRPPFPVNAGLWARPTALNKVETFANVPAIILEGAEAYAALGSERNSGTKRYCISGHVNRPGVYEVPFGLTLRSLIEDHAGGTAMTAASGITWDKGGNYVFPNTMPLGQFYHVSFNMEVPYRVCGGLQDNGTWCGPSRKSRGEISNADWFYINGGDGFYTQQDPNHADIVYAESQGGSMAKINLVTGARTSLQKPDWRQHWTLFEDSVAVDWPDTNVRLQRAQQRRIDDLRRRQRADSASMSLRWNWSTPFIISRHNPSVFYAGASKVMKSTQRGDGLQPISPDLTKTGRLYTK